MKRAFLVGVILSLTPFAAYAIDHLLPDDFVVYVQGYEVTKAPYEGFEPRILPTNNDDLSDPGCYMACYSHNALDAAYAISKNIYVKGQVRVAGQYEGNICRPVGDSEEVSAQQSTFSYLCNAKIPSCEGECWAGGDTGGWFE